MGKRSEFKIELIVDERHPIFLNLANSIIREIERGRLRPGDSLPGTRALAKSLKLNRNTVDASFHELIMQGWITSIPSRGTFVSDDLPEITPSRKRREQHQVPEFIKKETKASFHLKVSEGTPDPRLLPADDFARAFRRALSKSSFLADSGYGNARGALSLRNTLADYLMHERGHVTSAENIMITRGSQMGLFLSACAIIEPGDVIAVEEPGYPLAWTAFRAAGARVIGIDVDEQGLDVAQVARLAQREPKLKAIYTTPHHQYPTTVTLSAGRRLKLLDIARRYNLTIIEDDYDHEYSFDARPVLPLAAKAEHNQSIIYLGSFSKLLAPAIRIGYAVTSVEILTRMADHREAIDRQGDLPLEEALAIMIEDGELSRNTRKASRVYEQRRNFLITELERTLGDELVFDVPSGGLALWLRLRPGLSAETWASNAFRMGLSITPGLHFCLDTTNAKEAFRVGYANLDEKEIKRLVDLLAKSRPAKKK